MAKGVRLTDREFVFARGIRFVGSVTVRQVLNTPVMDYFEKAVLTFANWYAG